MANAQLTESSWWTLENEKKKMKQDTPSQGMHKSEYILRLFESGRSIPLGTHPLVNTCFMITKIGIRNPLMEQIMVEIKLENLQQYTRTSVLPQWVMHSTQRIGSASVIVLILLVITVVDFLSTVHVSNLQNLDSQYWDIKHQPIEKIACSRKLTCSEVVACSGLLSSRNRNRRGNLREIP